MKIIEVVAGIIFNSEQSEVLLALRKPEQHQGDRWEFPGGKLDGGEACREGLVRELEEEIGIAVTQCHARSIIEHTYPDKQVRLHFWDVTKYDGVPEGCEGQALKWVALSELGEYRFPDANQGIVDELLLSSSTT
jgi:8-oxo-dGTP diphosphatase